VWIRVRDRVAEGGRPGNTIVSNALSSSRVSTWTLVRAVTAGATICKPAHALEQLRDVLPNAPVWREDGETCLIEPCEGGRCSGCFSLFSLRATLC
jgi:hypothetical protein